MRLARATIAGASWPRVQLLTQFQQVDAAAELKLRNFLAVQRSAAQQLLSAVAA